MIIQNLHRKYNGLCIEFKRPKVTGVLSNSQKTQLERYELNIYKVIVWNDYDSIVTQIIDCMRGTRILCSSCNRGFKSSNTLGDDKRYIHRLGEWLPSDRQLPEIDERSQVARRSDLRILPRVDLSTLSREEIAWRRYSL